MRIAIDAMGGDNAPEAIVRGAVQTAKKTDAELILVGDERKIKPFMHPGACKRIAIHHTEEYVGMDEVPSVSLRKKKNASVAVAAALVQRGEAQAMISAGNTGALMEAALLNLGRIKGIKRPALGVFLPTYRDITLLLDAGANTDCRPEYLYQFAEMGSIYAEKVMNRPRPKVALLNIGTEPGKGNSLVQATFDMLARSSLNFVGNIEPADFLEGCADVVVADGFLGNLVLKTAEGTADLFIKILKEYVQRALVSKVAAFFLRPVFRDMKKKLDHSEHGGALLLGLRGICIKSHGRADARTIESAVNMAARAVKDEIVTRIAQSIEVACGAAANSVDREET